MLKETESDPFQYDRCPSVWSSKKTILWPWGFGHWIGTWLTWCRFSCNAFSNYIFTPTVVSWLFSGPSPWVPDSCAGFLTQTIGWRLSSWLTVAVFTSPSDSSPSITLRVPDSCAGFRTHLRGSRLKPLVGDSRRDSPLQFSPPLVISLLQAPSPLGFLTHVRGSRLICGVPDSNLWLATLVVTHRCSFHPLVIPLLQAPSPLGFLTHVRGSGLICGVPDSNLWLATLVVTHRCSFHLP